MLVHLWIVSALHLCGGVVVLVVCPRTCVDSFVWGRNEGFQSDPAYKGGVGVCAGDALTYNAASQGKA